MSHKPTIAFFGATGGCALAALVLALQNGFRCAALARSPEKLVKLLSDNGVTAEQQKKLAIVKGNVKDVNSVKETLYLDGEMVDIILSGVGAAPVFHYYVIPSIDDPYITESALKAYTEALQGSPKKPLMVAISTTGIDDRQRDVPLLLTPLYYALLHVPHQDKRKMEAAVLSLYDQKLVSGFSIVRASLLMDGESAYDSVRAGYVGRKADSRWNTVDGPAVGYTIRRKDVGRFIFNEILSKKDPGEWLNQHVVVSY